MRFTMAGGWAAGGWAASGLAVCVWTVCVWTVCVGALAGIAGGADARSGADARGGADEGFAPLFDSASLDGWNGDPAWFRVEKETIVAGTLDKPIPHNVFLCTDSRYEDFELRLEVKLVGQGDNAGVQFRTARIPGSHEVSGYQADMGSAGGRPVWGSLYDESRRRKMLVSADADVVRKVLRPDDWNRMVIRCEGPRIQIWLNDLQTVDYTEMDEKIERSGVIALQIHGGPPAEASYRNVRLKKL